jgi:hypothetical protein
MSGVIELLVVPPASDRRQCDAVGPPASQCLLNRSIEPLGCVNAQLVKCGIRNDDVFIAMKENGPSDWSAGIATP